MKQVYQGKTKDVFELDNGNYLLKNAMIKRIHCSKLKLCNMNRRIFG